MRTTHRRTWRKERWLIVDERTGNTHYVDEMVRERDTGLLVHRNSVDQPHPQLRIRPKYNDPKPVYPVIPDDTLVLGQADLMLCSEIGETGIERKPSAADHLFNTGIGCMVIEGENEYTDFEVI